MTGRALVLDVVPGLRDLARRQAGVVRREQLAALGVTHDHVRTQVLSRRWVTIGPRLVVLHTGALSRHQQLTASVLHASVVRAEDGVPDLAALTARTALDRLGLTRLRQVRGRPDGPVTVTVPRGARPPKLPGVVIRQSSRWPVLEQATGVAPACLTAAWALVDAVDLEPRARSAAGLALAVVQQRLATAAQVLDALDRAGRVRHQGEIRRVLELASGADSLAELDVVRLLRRAGLRDVRKHVLVEMPSGLRPVDLVATLPDGRTLVVEVDGPHHRHADQQRDDVARDAELIALGFLVIHVPVAALADERMLLSRFRSLARGTAG